MVQPAFELPVESLNHSATEPTMLATLLFIDLIVASTSETFQHILCSQDRLTTSPLDRRCSKGGEEWGLLETDCVIFLDHDPTFLLDDPSIHPPIPSPFIGPLVRLSVRPTIHSSIHLSLRLLIFLTHLFHKTSFCKPVSCSSCRCNSSRHIVVEDRHTTLICNAFQDRIQRHRHPRMTSAPSDHQLVLIYKKQKIE